jgi:hypothetical protein
MKEEPYFLESVARKKDPSRNTCNKIGSPGVSLKITVSNNVPARKFSLGTSS